MGHSRRRNAQVTAGKMPALRTFRRCARRGGDDMKTDVGAREPVVEAQAPVGRLDRTLS